MVKPLRYSLIGLAVAVVSCGPNNEERAATPNKNADRMAEEQGAAPAAAPSATEGAYGDAVRAAARSGMSMPAADFVANAAQANMLEIKASEAAEQRAQRDEVRALAKTLIADHEKIGDSMKTMLAGSDLSAPAALDSAHQAKLNDVVGADADNFDKNFMDFQEEAHESAVSLFERYARDGDNDKLQTFASTTLPVLRGHLAQVRKIREGFDLGDDFLGLGSGDDEADAPAGDENMTTETPDEPSN